MTPLEVAVRGLLDRLQRLGREQALRLVRPPLPSGAVRSAFDGAGLLPTAPVLDWYSAWDGQSAEGVLGEMDVLPGFYALSVHDALAHRQAQQWPDAWLPLLADGGGDFYVVDTGAAAAPVLRCRFDSDEPEAVAASLVGFMETALRAFDDGVVFVVDAYLEQDEERWRALLGVSG